MDSDKPNVNDVEFSKEEILLGETGVYLLVVTHRKGEEWEVIPKMNIALIKNQTTGNLRAARPLSYMISDKFIDKLTRTPNDYGDYAVYISERSAKGYQHFYRDLTNSWSDYDDEFDDEPREWWEIIADKYE